MGNYIVQTETQATEGAIDQLLSKLQPLRDNAYILTVPKGIKADIIHELRNAWNRLNAELGTHKILFTMPEELTPQSLRAVEFDFSITVKLLKLGYRLQRTKWDGYLYMRDGIIYHSNDGNKEYKPTQKAILATNWVIV